MFLDDLFDVGRIDVEPACDDHVLLAVHDVKVPVLVHFGNVAGIEPAVLEDVAGLGGHIPVALHHHRAFEAQLADFPDTQFLIRIVQADDLALDVGERQADAAHAVLAIDRVAVTGRGRFGKPIAFAQPAAGQLFKLVLRLWHEWRAPADARANRADVEAAEVGIVVDRVIHRRHAGENARLIGVDRREDVFQIARIGDQHQRGRCREAKVHRGHHPVNVEQRDGAQDDLLALPDVGHERLDRQRVGDEIAVQRHRAFGDAGRAARVLENRNVVGADIHFGPVCGSVLIEQVGHPHIAPGQLGLVLGGGVLVERKERLEESAHVIADVRDDDALDLRLWLHFLDPRVEIARRDHQFRAAVVELVFHLTGRVERVGGDDNPAGFHDAIVGDDELGRVGHQDDDAVAFLDAQFGQRPGHPVGQVVKGPVIHLAAGESVERAFHRAGLENERGVVGIVAGGLFQESKQRDLRVGLQSVGNPLVVFFQPGLVLHVILLRKKKRLRDVAGEWSDYWVV